MNIRLSAEDRMIIFFRYLSLFLTSLMFLVTHTGPALVYKIPIILALGLLAHVFIAFFRSFRHKPHAMMASVTIEMLLILLLTICTGGYDSPFKLYSLNPILIAAGSLSYYFCWSLLAGYFAIFLGFCYFFYKSLDDTFASVLLENGNLFLALALTATFMQLLSKLRRQREEAEARTDEMLEHIKSLYHIVETSSEHDFMNIGQVITDYALKLTKLNKALFWFAGSSGGPSLVSRQTGWPPDEEENLFGELKKYEPEWRRQKEPIFRSFPGFGDLLMMPVRMSTRFVGVIGVKLEAHEGLEGRRWYIQQLMFLAELSAITLERHELSVTENRLIVTNEQNRIADEMHDSVSQSLFGIVYAAHSLKQSFRRMTPSQLEEQIELIHDSATKAAKELRITIYSLSSKKSGGPTWLGMVRSHLKSLSRLNDVEIVFKVKGDDFSLPYPYHKALFRIISEATGNAIRHGGAGNIEVELTLKPRWIGLAIRDDGIGFDTDLLWTRSEEGTSGLGMKNMQHLASSLGGDFQLSSNENAGTQILISIPVGVVELKNA
ncbi:NarL family two-component system sensor histidine kinase LiaS [Paenibacillus forsythiae]|uniref:Oxygen sensor histidine kinase NreB n=1 Tax=Paenibacillus forsythiae TaxID=365616 RepID=A0ABU3H8I7_9BACL|nr:ATP-binding protein [Paenibacillus forsythiae]MDT3427132.1 NarL family two-component system sensor histidine kinase LiaS [Paenibacillus forsythiae]